MQGRRRSRNSRRALISQPEANCKTSSARGELGCRGTCTGVGRVSASPVGRTDNREDAWESEHGKSTEYCWRVLVLVSFDTWANDISATPVDRCIAYVKSKAQGNLRLRTWSKGKPGIGTVTYNINRPRKTAKTPNSDMGKSFDKQSLRMKRPRPAHIRMHTYTQTHLQIHLETQTPRHKRPYTPTRPCMHTHARMLSTIHICRRAYHITMYV